MSFSDYLEKKILDHLFGKASYTAPTIYVALSTADPGDDASGIAEPSGNNYSRVQTAAGDWNSATSGAGTLTNANAVTFAQASGSWGTITHIALYDAATSGNLLASRALGTSKTIGSNDTLSFAAGQITTSLA